MENFAFIESGFVLALQEPSDINKIKFGSKDFSIHREAFDFVIKYLDENKKAPPKALLEEKFSAIDFSASGISLDYCLEQFGKQVLYRKIVRSFKSNQETLKEEPQKALAEISKQLDEASLEYDENISVYDSGSEERVKAYEKRKELRKVGLKIIGLPTPVKSINRKGVGFLNGELEGIFARPTVGKTWFAIKTAATALKYGYRTLFVSTEMSNAQIQLRLDVVLGQMNGYNFRHSGLRKGELSEDEEKQYRDFLRKNSSKKLFVSDHIGETGLTLAGINMLVRKHKPDLLVVDGIHLLSGDEARGEVWQKMHKLCYGMKNLCVTRNIVGFITTQASRGAADLFTPPDVRDVAFGDALLQAADILMSMCKTEANDKERIVQLQKYRDDENSIPYVNFDWDVNIGVIQEKKANEELA